MKALREIKRWMNRMRKRFGKKNGVVPCGVLDCPDLERKAANNKRQKEIDWGRAEGKEIW